MPSSGGRIPSLTARRVLDRPTGLNRELSVAEGVRTGLGPPLGGAWVVCRFGLFLIDKSAFPEVRQLDLRFELGRPHGS